MQQKDMKTITYYLGFDKIGEPFVYKIINNKVYCYRKLTKWGLSLSYKDAKILKSSTNFKKFVELHHSEVVLMDL